MEHDSVEERLAALDEYAEEAAGEAGGFVEVSSTWELGRRWGRRRRAVASFAAVLSVGVLATLGWVVPQATVGEHQVVFSDGVSEEPSVPDQMWDTPTRAGLLGWGTRVLAAQEAPRARWFGHDTSVAVVTIDGRQGFVEMPDYAGGLAVSPDGRRIAHWAMGETSGTPNTSSGWGRAITGLAVRDVVDGTVRVHRFESEHGISPEHLYWGDDTLLVAQAGAWRAGDDGNDMDRASSHYGEGILWDLDAPAPTQWSTLFADDVAVPYPSSSWARDGIVVSVSEAEGGAGADSEEAASEEAASDEAASDKTEVRWVEEYDLSAGTVRRVGTVRGVLPSGAPLTTDGERIFLVGDLKRSQLPNFVLSVPRLARGTAEQSRFDPGASVMIPSATVMPGSHGTLGFFGVRGDTVLVSRIDDPDHASQTDGGPDVYAMSVGSGERVTELLVDVRRDGKSEHGSWHWATELLESAPVVAGVEPESPVSPWLWIGAGAGVLVLGLGIAGVWWRRAQP